MKKSKFVEPVSEESRFASELAESLRELRVASDDVPWIIDAVGSRELPDPPLDDGEDREDGVLRRASTMVGHARTRGTNLTAYDRDEALLRILVGLVRALASEARDQASIDADIPAESSGNAGMARWSRDMDRKQYLDSVSGTLTRRRIRTVAALWAKVLPAIDFARGMRAWSDWYLADDIRVPLTRALHDLGALDATKSFDVSALLRDMPPMGPDPYRDPSHAQFWLASLGPRGLQAVLPAFDRLSDADFALAVARLIDAAAEVPKSRWNGRERNMRRKSRCRPSVTALSALLDRVERRLEAAPRDLRLLDIAWQIGAQLECRGDGLDRSRRERLLSSAHGAIGSLRASLADEQATDEPHPDERRYVSGLLFIGRASEMRRAIRAALLLQRALRVPSVAADLRYWREPGHADPPARWSWIPTWTVELVHRAAREDDDDEALAGMREFLAEYFLSRLTTRDGKEPPIASEDLVETVPEWRRCYIRAVRELRVNPGGRGHRVLFWLSSHDPDPEVRTDARIAYDEMRRGTLLAPGVSPRRAVLAAIWWVRQGHAIDVGIEIDADGANRTRQKEGRRSKQEEKQDREQ